MIRSTVLFSLAALTAFGQAQTDYSKVEIKTTKITNNFYTLEGSGGTIGTLVGPEGVFMAVDGELSAADGQDHGGDPQDLQRAGAVYGEHARSWRPHQAGTRISLDKA